MRPGRNLRFSCARCGSSTSTWLHCYAKLSATVCVRFMASSLTHARWARSQASPLTARARRHRGTQQLTADAAASLQSCACATSCPPELSSHNELRCCLPAGSSENDDSDAGSRPIKPSPSALCPSRGGVGRGCSVSHTHEAGLAAAVPRAHPGARRPPVRTRPRTAGAGRHATPHTEQRAGGRGRARGGTPGHPPGNRRISSANEWQLPPAPACALSASPCFCAPAICPCVTLDLRRSDAAPDLVRPDRLPRVRVRPSPGPRAPLLKKLTGQTIVRGPCS
jgi:hypothetical protein